MHIATSGQSWQPLFFCPSGQQGMSPDMADMSLISAAASRFAAAGVTSGAATSPTMTNIASKRPMSRRTFMTYHHIGRGILKAGTTSHVRNEQQKPQDSNQTHRVNSRSRPSSNTLRADKVHKWLPVALPEQHHFVPLRRAALHPGRSRRHTGNGQSDRGGPFLQQLTNGRRRHVALDDILRDSAV
jgi:hypothetical protein